MSSDAAEPATGVEPPLFPKTWTDDVNADSLVHDFADALNTEEKDCTGDFVWDYKRFNDRYEVVSCPFVKVCTSADEVPVKAVKVVHCAIDLSSWRCMLLALVRCEPPVTELVLHGLHLTDEHLRSFRLTMNRRPHVVTTLKMAYCSFSGGSVNQALAEAISSSVGYVSLKSCELPLGFLSAYAAPDQCHSAANVCMQVLDLSATGQTDEDAAALFGGLYLNVGLKTLALRNNACSGACLDDLARLLTGRIATADDSAVVLKAVQKAVGDRNKQGKDLSKARKTAGLPDLPDVPAADSRLFKVGAEGWIVNRGMATIDLSGCPITADSISEFCKLVVAQQPAVSADKANGAIHTAVVLQNLNPPLSEADKKALRAIDLKGITLAL